MSSLRSRLFLRFGSIVVVLGFVLAFVGVRFLLTQTIQQAQSQTRSDLNGAWGLLEAEMTQLETVLRLNSDRDDLVAKATAGKWYDAEVKNQLEDARIRYNVDFLSVVTPAGQVVIRSAPPYATDDYFLSEPLIQKAFKGEARTGITLLSSAQLDREHDGLAQRAFLVRQSTPYSGPVDVLNTYESRGMVLFSAVPIMNRNTVVAVMYGGVLLNRNEALVRKIEQSSFRNEKYKGSAIGTVTLFLHDCRIATTVLQKNGNLALGTLVSKEVADRVLDNGKPWFGRAFVVKDWYLTAYEPIRNINGETIGIFYVGLLEAPFNAMVWNLIFRYGAIIFVGILITLWLAYFVAGRLAKPLHALAEAAAKMAQGERVQVQCGDSNSREMGDMVLSFNTMATELAEREAKLREANTSLTTTNGNYMETLGYISHELKTPLGSIMNYVYLLEEMKLGELSTKQIGAVRNININTKRITEMVRHYLNLSRIESNQLDPKPAPLKIGEDILHPLLESLAVSLESNHQKLVNEIGDEVMILADFNMMFEVFENIINNAIKYGNEGGTINLAARDLDKMVEFHIRNTGPGIAPDKQSAVFEKFYRIDNETAGKRKKGTGLGLFITKHIIEAHGGTISIASEEGAWAEFIFTLPKPIQ